MIPPPIYGRRFVMTILRKRLAVLALGLTVPALASPSYAQEPAPTSARHARPPFRTAATSTTPTGTMPIGPVWLNTAKRSDLVGAMNRAAISGAWLREKCARPTRVHNMETYYENAHCRSDLGHAHFRRRLHQAHRRSVQRWPRRQSVGTKLQWLLPRVPSGGVVQD